MSWTEEKINQTMIDIKKKATEDEAFRKLCLDNPNEAIKQVSDIDVPGGLKINIIENEPGMDHTIILPPESHTLKDEGLDQIAGGKGPDCLTQCTEHCTLEG
ncbi:MAG: NHLP leader peptide family natural product precursor [Desulfobacterales bacterium]|nr:NHLP leader peptide family natural product precursor [Desulfobacterales bacterium]